MWGIMRTIPFLWLLAGIAQSQRVQSGNGEFLPSTHTVDTKRVKRTNSDIFTNSHVMHPNDYNKFVNSQDNFPQLFLKNHLNALHRNDVHLRRKEWVEQAEKAGRDPFIVPTKTSFTGFTTGKPFFRWQNPNPINQRGTHTLISGDPNGVRNSFNPKTKVAGPSGAINLFESSRNFNQLSIYRDNYGAGPISKISKFNSPFGAGLDDSGLPVHYQAKYTGGSRPQGNPPIQTNVFVKQTSPRSTSLNGGQISSSNRGGKTGSRRWG